MALITTNSTFQALEAGVSGWLGSTLARVRAWDSERKTIKALAALTDAELDDIGLTRSEIKYVARKTR